MTFHAWLMAQREREDPVGDLARDAAEDVLWPKGATSNADFRRHIDEYGVSNEFDASSALTAFDRAWAEWEVQR